MIDLDPKELAEVLWKTNQPQARALVKQDEAMQAVYVKAAEAVISWLVEKAVDGENRMQNCMDLLAEELAWKLLHPMQFSEGARDAFEQYAAIAGDSVSDQVREAMKI